jgi:20S proteasome subunit alpha 3
MRANDVLVEFATVGRTESGKVYHHLWGAEEIDALLKEHGLAKQEDTDMTEG